MEIPQHFRLLFVFILFQWMTPLVGAMGKFKTGIIETGNLYDFPIELQIDTSGRPLISFRAFRTVSTPPTSSLMRLLPDGNIDSTFRKGGHEGFDCGYPFYSSKLFYPLRRSDASITKNTPQPKMFFRSCQCCFLI